MALQYAFAIRFTNKRHTQGLTDTLSYLTQRSLNRRHKYHIAIDSTDYPVNPAYIDSVLQVSGTRLHLVSRWLNLCVVLTTDTASVQALASKPFVQQVLLVGTYIGKLHRTATNAATGTAPAAKTNAGDAGYYGKTWAQTALLQGQALHDKGYTGHNQLIAVFDAGFLGVDTHPAFDSLYQSGRIVDVHNFTYDTSYVYG